MPALNLTATNYEQEKIKKYLEATVSDTLAEKINNGVRIQKDGKNLLNKKTLTDFMKFACDKALKQTEKGVQSACIDDDVVYGWAVHYFEEDSIKHITKRATNSRQLTLKRARYSPKRKCVNSMATLMKRSPPFQGF